MRSLHANLERSGEDFAQHPRCSLRVSGDVRSGMGRGAPAPCSGVACQSKRDTQVASPSSHNSLWF